MPSNFPGYPDSWGNRRACVVAHQGPTSYTPVTEESPSAYPIAGGDLLEAVEAGMKYIDWVGPMVADGGIFRVEAIPSDQSQYKVPSETMILRWVILATGAEVAAGTNLSANYVRVLVVGGQ